MRFSRILFLMMSGMLFFHPAQAKAPAPPRNTDKDSRLIRLQQFFQRYNCPIRRLAPSFLRASDSNGIDWRLLPSLALVESGCGKESVRNNIFGWGNGSIPFRSVEHGIQIVADRLANGEYYRGKSTRQKLYTYNPRPGYVDRVQSVMRELAPNRFAMVAD